MITIMLFIALMIFVLCFGIFILIGGAITSILFLDIIIWVTLIVMFIKWVANKVSKK